MTCDKVSIKQFKKLDLNPVEIQIFLISYNGYILLKCCSLTAWCSVFCR